MNNEQRKLKVLDKFKTIDEFFNDWVVKNGWRAIVIHHSATKDGRAFDSQAIRQYHIKENGWQEIGYHLLIEKVEDEWYYVLGRPLSMSGAHSGTKTSVLYNKIGIGICVVGCYDETPPEQRALDMLREIVKKLMGYYNISRENVIGHWEVFVRLGLARTKEAAWVKYKTCPGKKFDLDAFRRTL
jgi:N-acetyl-anhydromuramyl-L-alanine amidase AmpD